jgi:predicted ester cyclase
MQPITGDYKDVPDFIYGITREIWEDRGIGGKLQKYYGASCLVRAATGLTADNTGVTAQTLATLHQFPDRQLVGEDVIWTAYDDGSFLSSHRLMSVMRHTGDGSYGPATNRLLRTRIIADCWVVNQVVTEEWLVRDQSAFARCLGQHPRDLARSMMADDLRRTGTVGFYLPEHDRPGVYKPKVQTGAEVEFYIDGYRRLWHDKEAAAVKDLYFHGACIEAPGGESFHGHMDIDRFYLGYLAAFPDAVFSVESAIINRDAGQAVRVALRWSLLGSHSGFGHFGPPSGAPVYVMGLSHAEIVGGRVAREWIAIDEVVLWKQILAHSDGATI